MTIEFNCPKCGALIAFDSKHAGRRARCLTCGQKFLIPAQSFKKPEKVAAEPEQPPEPVPGFYRAVFVDNVKLFVDPRNATTLVFLAAVVCFRFVLSKDWCLRYPANAFVWGWLFGFYLNVIYQTAFDEDTLPEIYLGTSITFLWYIIAPLLTFGLTLAFVELPFFIALWLFQDSGITLTNFGSGIGPSYLLLQFFFVLGLFAFPAAILTTAVGKDIALLRPDYLLIPVAHAFAPYVTCVVLLAAACFLQTQTAQYTGAGPIATALHLALNLLVQVVAIFAMRAIGLLYRHYACYFKW
ncbi:MAG: hypothetical protein RBR19_10310 [Sedimentisphaerales bacterium]|jgi:DNA-directed RNA polymerase subunit RPC12/RpoP|nr:hypothetical protein [Sedimentisphaerales bacterium]NLT75119.1 hypothetical protein [Planctomycetota bacterium]